jgi:hypothetical protein
MSLEEVAVSWNTRNVGYALSYDQMFGLGMRLFAKSAAEPTSGRLRFWSRFHVRIRQRRVSMGRETNSVHSWNITYLAWVTVWVREGHQSLSKD